MVRINKHCFLAILLFPAFLFSQLQVKNFFSATGKKDVPVNVIIQDFDGYLLLGTNDGVFRFDGHSAVPVLPEKNQLKKRISSLLIDETSKIWVGTHDGKVFTIFQNKLDSLDLPGNSEKITSFCETGKIISIGTYGNGIYTLQNQTLTHYDASNGLSDNVIYRLTCDRKNRLWAGTDAGITEISGLTAVPRFRVISNKQNLPDNIVRDLNFEDDKLIISMQDSGVCFFDLKKNRIEKNPFFSNWGLGTVLNARTQAPNKLVMITERNGLIQIDKGAINVYDYQHHIFTSAVNQLFIDREKQIWIASKKGISQFTERRYNFINAGNGLKDQKILALAMDNDNVLWLGTNSGISLAMTDDQGKMIIKDLEMGNKFSFSCAAKAPNGDIWFGTYGNGILVFRNQNFEKPLLIHSKSHGLSNDNISNISFSRQNQVIISTLGGGVVEGENSGPDYFRIVRTYRERDGLGSDYVYASLADQNGIIYFGTDGGGLQRLMNGKFEDLTRKGNLGSSTIFSICRDKHNVIWATSNADGLLKYDGKTIQKFGTGQGLRDEQPQQILACDNTLFAINSKGVDKINCQNNHVTYYDLLDGDLDPNLNAIVFSRDKIYSGTNNGVLTFRTSSESIDSIRPLVFISAFYLDYKPIPMDSIYEFRHDQNRIAIAFGGTWLKNPDKLLFRYKLHGLETDWQYSNEGKTVNYNNLDPGNYTFAVQVKNEEDVWSSLTGHSFIILKPIWKQWWFWLVLISVSAVLIYLLVNYRLRALQRENLLLERRVKERTYQIEKQSKIIESKNLELEQLSLVASKTDNVVLILDPAGRLEYINESFEKQSGLSVKQLKEQFGDSIYELSSNPDIRQIINDAVTNKRSVNYESLNKKSAGGVEQWESSTLTPIFDDEGKLKKIIIIDTDVTLRKKQEQIILQKNKDITDSISYAKKIQHAILPANDQIKAHLPDLFVLYMTKDIVSGDFYWFTHFPDCSIIAAVDCTGHGVPGAFMSLIGYNLLNRIINEERITDPRNILAELNTGVLSILHKNESESKDGMDIAICKINHSERTMEYAGAMRPLWIISSGAEGERSLKEIKADKIPIGTTERDKDNPLKYTTHTLKLQDNETYYIFTDGYADQFGGPKDKKYSTARFKDLLLKVNDLPLEKQEEEIRKEHLDWKAENEQIDDILVIGFKA